MKNRLRLLLLLLLLFLTFFCSCMESEDPAEKRAVAAEKFHGDILVGTAAPWSTLDGLLWGGMEMAVEEINGKGGVLGRRIRLLKKDDEGSVDQAIRIAQEFVENPEMAAVIGHYQSFVTIPASVMYQYYGILLLSTVPTDPRLTREGFSLVFRTVPDDNDFCAKLNAFCTGKGYSRFLLYHDSTEYGRTLADSFEIANEKVGIAMLDQQSYSDYTTLRDFRQVLTLWKQNYSFDAIFVAGRLPKAGSFIKTARDMGIHQPILGGLALDDKKLLPMLGKNVADVYVPTTFDSDSSKKRVQTFVAAFKKRYGKDPHTLAAQGYDTVYALADAIKRAGSASPPAIAKALLSGNGFEGLTGTVSFDDQGDRVGAEIGIKEVKNGRFEYIPQVKNAPDTGRKEVSSN